MAPKPGSEHPLVIQPAADVFARRAARFRALADGHPLADYLQLLASLSDAQHDLLASHPALPLPEAEACEQARRYGMPPLAVHSWSRDPQWRQQLAKLVDMVSEQAPAPLQAELAALRSADENRLEALASAVLDADYDPADSAQLPFVAAALQLYWSWMAMQPTLAGLRRLDVAGVCPCCGSLPVSSIIETEPHAGSRYLHCSLCNTAWNMVRVNCSSCGDTDQVGYRLLEDEAGSQHETVRAEVCDHCHSYLKQVRRDKDAAADPVADDLATLALDILCDEAEYARSGPNPLFIPG